MSGPVVTRVKSKKSLDPDAAALAAGTDELNLKLAAAEQALRELGLGVEGCIELESWFPDDAEFDFQGTSLNLCFRKIGNTWSLVLVAVEQGQEQTPTLLTAASRELRIKASLKLGKLLEEMRSQLRTEKQRIDEANAAVDAFLRSAKGTSHE